METTKPRPCRKCRQREAERESRAALQRYIDAIRPEDRANEAEYARRLAACRACAYHGDGICAACGCYVELRALGRHSRCPYKKWGLQKS